MEYWKQSFSHAARIEPQSRGGAEKKKCRRSKSFSCLDPKDKELVYRQLASASRELDKGYLSPRSYVRHRDRLLGKKEEKIEVRPLTTYPSAKTVKKKNREEEHREIGTAWQSKVSERSERERKKTLAWVERVAKRASVSTDSSVAVLVTRVPPRTTKTAVREALSAFGEAQVEKVGASTFEAKFSTNKAARNAVDAGTASLDCVVHVSPIPSDCDEVSLRRVMSKWGKVASVRFLDSRGETTTTSPSSASVVFESSKSASFAAGDRRIEAANELEVVGVPPDATVEHIRRSYGGHRAGVKSVTLCANNRAVVVFDGPKTCERHRGLKELVLTVQGGEEDATEQCRQTARKGADPPWHTQIPSRPFADFDLHSFQFGRAPSTTQEFKKRAAGTFSVHDKFYAAHSLKGSAAKFSTKRCQVHGKFRTTTLHVRQIHATIHLDFATTP